MTKADRILIGLASLLAVLIVLAFAAFVGERT